MADKTAVSGNKPTTLDKIEAGLLTREQFEYEVIDQVYAGLHIVEDELKRRMQAHLHRKDSFDSELLDE